MSANIIDADLVPELGDEIKIVGKSGKIHGIIVYRSERMIRVRPFSSKTVVYEFPLDENGDYMPQLGISETYIDPEKKAKDPHFSIQMEVRPGSVLEFYDREGTPFRKTVFEVIATETHDGLKFENGEVMDFGFIGLPDPFVTFLDVTNVDEDDAIANALLESERLVPEPVIPAPELANYEDDLITQLLEQQGDILQDESAQINRPYPEDQQRQDMFISVMQLIAPKTEQQKNPRILRKAYIETDMLAALKRSIVQLTPQGQPLLNTSKYLIVDTIDDVIKHHTPPILIPIVEPRKILNTDNENAEEDSVEIISLHDSLLAAKDGYDTFSKAVNAPRRTDNAFENYMRTMDDALKVYDVHPTPTFIPKADIEVYNGIPNNTVRGYFKIDLKPNDLLTADHVSDVPAYPIRLLSEGKSFRDTIANKTITLQVADTAKQAGYILLSPELAYARQPERTNVLLWDIQASEQSRNRQHTLQSSLLDAKDIQIFNQDEAVSISIRDVLRTRLQPSLSFMTRGNVSVIDSLGLRALELTRNQMYEFHSKMVEGQTQWDMFMTKMKEDTLAHLANESTYPVKPLISIKDSPLFSESLFADPVLGKFMEQYTNRETLYKSYDIALTSALMDEPYGTLLSYWSALVSQISHEHIDAARRAYTSEMDRQLRKQETQRELRRRFTSAPIINKCPHVREYEVVAKISNDSERMKALEAFVRKYNGGTQNNFVRCNKCLQNLICKHELLLIQEYKIQDQATAIHKQLVLEYGGPVFMGVYVCKNCGQKITNLEFDTHLEYDDEGRPLVGRAVLSEEPAEGDDEATKADQDAKIAYITDSSKDLQRDFSLYQNLKRVFEEAHIILMDELAKTLLEELKIFLGTLAPKEKYNLARKQLKHLPDYEIFYNQQLVGAMGALAVIELQNLPSDIPIPNRQCPYSRSGFPIDYLDGVKTDAIDLGAIKYITCVLSLITSSNPPWNSVLWADPSKKEDERMKMIQSAIISALAGMRGVDTTLKVAKPPISKLTDAQTKRLRAALIARTSAVQVRMETENGIKVEMKPSDADRLPSHFHPCPRYTQTPATEAIKLGNAESFVSNVASAAIPDIKPIVTARMQQLHQDIMYQFNTDADTSATSRTYKIEDVGRTGLGYKSIKLGENIQAEYTLMTKSYHTLDRRDPSRPNTGTHVYVPWNAPESDIIEPTPDETIYYKLFSKVCAIGDNKGAVHEFTYGNVCRYCRFKLDDVLIYETNSEIPPSTKDVNARQAAQAERRKAAVEDACRAIGVEINEFTFNELRAEINMNKQVPPRQLAVGGSILERISGLEAYLPETSQPALNALIAGMQTILGDGSLPPLYGNARYRPLHEFYRLVDEIKARLIETIVDSIPVSTERVDKRTQRATETLDLLESILGNITGDECLRSMKRMFIFNSRFARMDVITPNIPTYRWIPNVYKGHQQDLMKRITHLDAHVQESLTNYKDVFNFEDDQIARDTLYICMNNIATAIGSFIRYWQENIRPNQVFVVQENINEYTTVLRWCIYSILQTELDRVVGIDLVRVKQFICEWILKSIISEQTTYALYRKTPEEIKASMNDRREREKAHKIKKQDDEKDPEIRKLMRTALKLGYSEDAILRKSGYNAEAESVRFQELQALGITADRDARGAIPTQDEGMGDIRDEDGGDI
jgi:hypothetical protein